MKDIGYEILCLFKGLPNRELSTSDIIENVFSSDFSLIKDVLENEYSSKESVKKAKFELAGFQRKVLYYTSKFEKEKTLRVTRVEGRGKKYFTMNLPEGGTIELKGKKIIIEKPSFPALPIGYLEDNNFVHKVESNHFFDRVNAVLLFNVDFGSLSDIYDYVYSLFSDVNDVIGILNFEKLVQDNSVSEIVKFLKDLNKEVMVYNKRLCCIVDFTFIDDSKKMISFFEKFVLLKAEGVSFVFDVKGREYLDQEYLVENLVRLYSENSMKLNFKNDDLCKSPYILGKAGPYHFDCDIEELKKSSRRGVVCVQASIVVDAKKVISEKSAKALKEDVLACSKALLYVNAHQRKNLSNVFSRLTNNNQVFVDSKNCIRFWNYEVFDENIDNLQFLDTLESIKQEVRDFSRVEEIIYLSCGMPTAFKVNFSIAYKRFKGSGLKQEFEKIKITNIKDLYSPKLKERINFYEKGFKVFDGGHEIRFFRSSNAEVVEILRELGFILNSFKLNFFCYNFSGKVGLDMSLNSFIE